MASDVVSSMCFVVAIASAKYIVRLCSPQRFLRLPLPVPVLFQTHSDNPSSPQDVLLYILSPSVLFSLYTLLLVANAVVTAARVLISCRTGFREDSLAHQASNVS